MGNKARVEPSICNAYLTEEVSNFLAHYFGSNVDTKARDLGQNVRIGVDEEVNPDLPSIFSENVGYAISNGASKYLNDRDYDVAHQYVLSNCELLREYEQYDLYS